MAESQSTFTPSFDLDDRSKNEALVVDVDGFEGPLDLLLNLSRSQKVDLLKISVLDLAQQYLAFIEKAKELRIEMAADYLVMAAWLAFLKSRLLLPPDVSDDGPSADDLAAHLTFQLERLQAMRNAAAQIMALNQKGLDFFARGLPEKYELVRQINYTATLFDLMQAYSRVRTRDEFRPFTIERQNVFSMEEALEKMRNLIVFSGEWTDLCSYIPEEWRFNKERIRAATAAHFAASLELAKTGVVELRQQCTFGRLELRGKTSR